MLRLHPSAVNIQPFRQGDHAQGVGIKGVIAIIGNEVMRAEMNIKANPGMGGNGGAGIGEFKGTINAIGEPLQLGIGQAVLGQKGLLHRDVEGADVAQLHGIACKNKPGGYLRASKGMTEALSLWLASSTMPRSYKAGGSGLALGAERLET